MEDILTEFFRIVDAKGIAPDKERLPRTERVMEAIKAQLELECTRDGKANSEDEIEAVKEKLFRIEAAKQGMTPIQIEQDWFVHSEARRITDRVMREGA